MSSEKKQIKSGELLVAEPFMKDPNFKRTVVLICEHHDEGAFGLVLNKKMDFTINEIMDNFPDFPTPVFYGGPVSPDTLHFIHSYGEELEGSVQLNETTFWSGNFEQLKLLIEMGQIKADQIRFFVGYSGWSPGQLDHELNSNSWIVSTNFDKLLMDDEQLWQTVLNDMGGNYKFVSTFPEDPSLN